MFLLRIWSPALRTHLRYQRAADAELAGLRIEIADYLHEVLAQGKGGRLATLEVAPGAEDGAKDGWETVERAEFDSGRQRAEMCHALLQ